MMLLRKIGRSPHLMEVGASYGSGMAFGMYMCLFQFEMGVTAWLLYAILGSIVYTFLEYWFHRIILHEILDMAHSNHHRWPRNLRIIATPILPVQLYDCIAVLILMYFLGRPAAYAINCGVAIGQIIMDSVHVAFHSHYRPWYLESARSYHLHHHFSTEDVAHGLTTPFWDMIFGTMPSDTWFYYKRYPWARYLQLPFPLLSFVLMALLAGETTKTSGAEQKLSDHAALDLQQQQQHTNNDDDDKHENEAEQQKPKRRDRRVMPHGSARSNYILFTLFTTYLVTSFWQLCW